MKDYLEMAAVLEWIDEIIDNESLAPNLWTMYKWELMYSMIEHSKNVFGSRRNGVLQEISRRMIAPMAAIKSDLLAVYDDWLRSHTTDPQAWAEMRYDYENVRSKKLNRQNVIDNALWDLDNYITISVNTRTKLENAMVKRWKTDNPGMTKKGYTHPYQWVLSHLTTKAFKDVMITFYRDIAFPAWYQFWKKEGIDKTIARLQTIRDELASAPASDFRKCSRTAGVALHSAHQTGEMMDHIERMYGVKKRVLNKMSNPNKETIAEWQQELAEAGFVQ